MAIKKVKNSKLAKAKAAARKRALEKQRERAEKQSTQDNLEQDVPLPEVTITEWDQESVRQMLYYLRDKGSLNPQLRVQFTAGAMLRFLVTLGVINRKGEIILDLPIAERTLMILDHETREYCEKAAEEREQARKESKRKGN